MLDNLPNELKNLDNFLVWRLEDIGKEKPAKIPYNPDNHWKCAVTKKENFASFYKAKEVFKKSGKNYSGVGIGLFPAGLPSDICVVDFDGVLDGSGELLPQFEEIQEWIEDFNTYTEVSQSKTGLHLFFYGNPPGATTRKALSDFPVEIYCKGRFIAVTGEVWHGYNQIRECQQTLENFYYRCFGKDNPKIDYSRQETTLSSDRSDETILKIISHSRNAAKFNALFSGGGDSDDRSADDIALANIIAFYTQDSDQIISIMRKSSLVRAKWDNHKTYLEMTAKKAINGLTAIFDWAESDRKNNEFLNRKNEIQPPSLNIVLPEQKEDLPVFWTIKNDEETGDSKIKISDSLLMDFFKIKGYRKLPTSSDTKTEIVIVDGCFLEHTGSQDIISMIVKYTQRPEFSAISNKLASLLPKLNQSLNTNYWRILDKIIPKPNIDTMKTGHHFFKNGVVNISEREITITDYASFKGVVWKHHVNNHEFIQSSIKGEFEVFCENTQRDKSGVLNPLRWSAFKSFFGYALHKYHNVSNARALIIQDEAIRQYKTEANGGTGKSIIAKAIQILRPGFYLDCKMADFKNDAFLYDGAKPDDQSLLFDDVKNTFPFEFVYNQVEKPAMINAKGRNKVPFDNVPKYIITSNSIIDVSSESSKRRVAMIFCGTHYHNGKTPFSEFGHNLFIDWDNDQWQAFYSFAMNCIQFYLINGLIYFEPESYAKRYIIETYSHDAYMWLKEFIIPTGGLEDQRLETDLTLQSYIAATGDMKKSKTKLTKMILDYAKHEKLKISVVSSGGKRYYEINSTLPHTTCTL